VTAVTDVVEKLPLPVPRLADPAVVLRGWWRVDLLAVLAAGRDPVVSRVRYSLPRSEQEALDWFRAVERDRVEGERLELAVTASSSGAAVGSIALADLEHGNGMLRYWLLPEGRGPWARDAGGQVDGEVGVRGTRARMPGAFH
jgi:RimJ/RimL family protein N-acetyltransferase